MAQENRSVKLVSIPRSPLVRGVFVAYYNQARILDEGSLETVRTLPNIPGAVNDFDGGRTYLF